MIILLLLSYAVIAKEVAQVKSVKGKVVVKRDNKIVTLKKGSKLYELVSHLHFFLLSFFLYVYVLR